MAAYLDDCLTLADPDEVDNERAVKLIEMWGMMAAADSTLMMLWQMG